MSCQSYQDDGMLIGKGCNCLLLERLLPPAGLEPGPPDQQAMA